MNALDASENAYINGKAAGYQEGFQEGFNAALESAKKILTEMKIKGGTNVRNNERCGNCSNKLSGRNNNEDISDTR